MSTSYQDRSAAIQAEIFRTDYYTQRYLGSLKRQGMTSEGIEKKQYPNRELHALWEEFWWNLPDNPGIRVEPFFKICDMCEAEEALSPLEGDTL